MDLKNYFIQDIGEEVGKDSDIALCDKALEFYQGGCNCSECLVKAADFKYNLNLHDDCLRMCSALSSGFGCGGMCSLLVAGTMVFGLLFDWVTAKRLRTIFLYEFQSMYPSFNCVHLKNNGNKNCKNPYCGDLVVSVSQLIEKIISDERALES